MFTGIIEEIGTMKQVTKHGQAMILTINAKRVLEDIHLGDSISVNGVCLTAVSFDSSSFSVDVMPETYRKTNLFQLSSGSRVNLERAMQVNGRFGGHIVQGHVDGTGIIQHKVQEENAIVYTIKPDNAELFQYIINQGSITLDGISLTIVKAVQDIFSVSIIPHTLSQTVLQHKEPGDIVNIECDLLGKYVNHLLEHKSRQQNDKKNVLTESFLAENGFL